MCGRARPARCAFRVATLPLRLVAGPSPFGGCARCARGHLVIALFRSALCCRCLGVVLRGLVVIGRFFVGLFRWASLSRYVWLGDVSCGVFAASGRAPAATQSIVGVRLTRAATQSACSPAPAVGLPVSRARPARRLPPRASGRSRGSLASSAYALVGSRAREKYPLARGPYRPPRVPLRGRARPLASLQRSLALPFCSLIASSAAPLRRRPFVRRASPSLSGSLSAPLRSSGSVLLPPAHSSLRYRYAAASPLQHRSPPHPPVRRPVNLSGLAVVRSERLRALPLSRGLCLPAAALLVLLGRFACAPSLARGRSCLVLFCFGLGPSCPARLLPGPPCGAAAGSFAVWWCIAGAAGFFDLAPTLLRPCSKKLN